MVVKPQYYRAAAVRFIMSAALSVLMQGLSQLLLLVLLECAASSSTPRLFPELDALRPQVSSSEQERAVVELLQRLVPSHASQFEVEIRPSDDHLPDGFAKIGRSKDGQKIRIFGNSGVDAATAIQRYLRDCCNAHFSWDGNRLDALPNKLPLPQSTTSISSIGKLRYFGNICTFSYSFVWWQWDHWEQFIDWLALSGFNLPLAPIGQEFIWQDVWRKYGLNQTEIDDHFSGPAFLAWFRMGNLRKWGGPLSQAWLKGQMDLQKKILNRMLSLGMTPVLPTFAGHVPREIRRLYPTANISKVACWVRFSDEYSCLDFVDPLDPLFKAIAQSFIAKQREVYGLLTHAYSADPFNEMAPSSFDLSYLAHVAKSIYNGAALADPQAIWVMQGWMFANDGDDWTSERVKAFLSGVPNGRVLVLDLYSERVPCYSKYESYYGHPFIWNMLHNFGGVSEMRGSFHAVNEGISQALLFPNVTMVGAGLTMEGIFQNYIQYQFMIDRIWSRNSLNETQWVADFITQRYGHVDKLALFAWSELRQSVYSEPAEYSSIPSKAKIDLRKVNTASDVDEKRFSSHVFKRPHLLSKLDLWYNPKKVCSAWKALLYVSDSFGQNAFFKQDLIDISREALQLVAANMFVPAIASSYRHRSLADVVSNGTALDLLLEDLDTVLSMDNHFSLANWRKSAGAKASTANESRLFDMNARNQVTLWGPNGEIVDYARKEWSGLIDAYYRPRWALFVKQVTRAVSTRKRFSQRHFDDKVFEEVERPFATGSLDQLPFAETPNSTWIDGVKHLYKRYFALCNKLT